MFHGFGGLVLGVLAPTLAAQSGAPPSGGFARPAAGPRAHELSGTLPRGDPGTLVGAQRIDREALGGIDLVNPGDSFGYAAVALGDLDGDGRSEVAVGAPFYDAFNHGAVWILFLEADGSVREARRLTTPTPAANGSRFGQSLAPLGDVDGDGTPDLAVGEPGVGAGGIGGAFWVLFLRPDGSIRSSVSRLNRATTFPGVVGPLEGFGEALGAIGDLDGDGVTDLAVGSPQGDFGSPNHGHLWITLMNADGTPRTAVKVGQGLGGFSDVLVPTGRFGAALAGLGDLDGDGLCDLAVGAPGNEEGGFSMGRVWILFLNADGTVKGQHEVVELAGGRFGSALLAPGDHDGDGVLDLVVSAQRSNLVRLLHLHTDGRVKDQLEIGAGLGGFGGALQSDDRFGSALAGPGDLNGDGLADLVVGAQFDDLGGNRSGAVWPLFLDAAGAVIGQRRIASEAAGPTTASAFGGALAELGDLDGDGVSELVMSSPEQDVQGGLEARGAVWILFPDGAGAIRRFQRIDELTGGYTGPLGFTNRFGASLAPLGDLDGDGTDDLALGITHSGFTANGRVAILFLNPDGTVRAQTEITQGQAGFTGLLDAHDFFGQALANLGDLDGDGLVDLAVGAPGDRNRGIAPAVWVLFLNRDGSVRAQRRIAAGEGGGPADIGTQSQFGFALACLGDLEGDGVPELAVGVVGDSLSNGAVWLLSLASDGAALGVRRIDATQGGFTGTVDGGFGRALSSLGDLDGDGVVDLAVGAPFTDTVPGSTTSLGGVWMLFLRADGTVRNQVRLDSRSAPSLGLTHNTQFGGALALVGDRNGDGVRDLFASLPGPGPDLQAVGFAWVLFLGGLARLDFEVGPDLVRPLANGQVPAFAPLFELSGAGPNLGPALFDSTPHGPNSGGADPDLLVGRGNVLILQDARAPQQSAPGTFDKPSDALAGGVLRLGFPRPVELLSLDLVDLDAASGGAKIVLVDEGRRRRTYEVPAGWTEDLLKQGPPAVRTLDLRRLAPQPGFLGATVVHQEAGFDPATTVELQVRLIGPGALDELRWDPYPAADGSRPR